MEITVINRAYSVDTRGNRLLTVSATFPRMILAEVNTHRMLSKNTSSSRAIPFAKMLEAVQNNPFIPIAWQKRHPGMQGTEYLSKTEKFNLVGFIAVLQDTFEREADPVIKSELEKSLKEKIKIINNLLTPYAHLSKTLDDWWLFARDKAVEIAAIMYVFDVTKQNCNRLLEPFMWTTMLITGPVEGGWDNFFRLRCPQYTLGTSDGFYKSRKDLLKAYPADKSILNDDLYWLSLNKGQAEIHIMELAEKIYDLHNQEKPVLKLPGEYHLPYFNEELLHVVLDEKLIEVSSSLAARESYTVVGEEKAVSNEKHIALYNKLVAYEPPHSSPLEHTGLCMSDLEYYSFFKGSRNVSFEEGDYYTELEPVKEELSVGWCRNFKGFIPWRHIIEK